MKTVGGGTAFYGPIVRSEFGCWCFRASPAKAEQASKTETVPSGAFIHPAETDSAVRPAPLLIHIGLHKTGTSWLQEHVFRNVDLGFQSIGDAPRHRIVEHFVCPDPLCYDTRAMSEHYGAHCAHATSQGQTLVLSHERLSGYPASGGYDRTLIAERLRDTFPDARILIVVREQKSLIRSMYSQYITDGGTASLRHFLQVPEPALGRKPFFSLHLYEFDRLVEYYFRLFGARNVLVLPFEMLAANPQEFVRQVQLFSGHPARAPGTVRQVNSSRPLLMQYAQRPFNALFSRTELSPGGLFYLRRAPKRFARLRPLFERISPAWLERTLDRRLRDFIERHVGDNFAESNDRLSDLTGIAFAEFGYASLRQRSKVDCGSTVIA